MLFCDTLVCVCVCTQLFVFVFKHVMMFRHNAPVIIYIPRLGHDRRPCVQIGFDNRAIPHYDTRSCCYHCVPTGHVPVCFDRLSQPLTDDVVMILCTLLFSPPVDERFYNQYIIRGTITKHDFNRLVINGVLVSKHIGKQVFKLL